MSVPDNIDYEEAVELVNDNGIHDFGRGYNACVFEETDTLAHVPYGSRLIICVFDKDGKNKTPVLAQDKFQQSTIAVAATVPKGFVGPKTACKEVGPSNKQTLYMDALAGNKASVKFFAELRRVYSQKVYTKAVADHPMHAAKNGLFKGNDVAKGIGGIWRKGKVWTPFGEDDSGNFMEYKASRKVFGARHEYRATNTDFDREDIEAYCKSASETKAANPAVANSNVCVDPMPIYFNDQTRVTKYDDIRSAQVAMAVLGFRGDWCNRDLANISFPNTVEAVQFLDVKVADSHHEVLPPNFQSRTKRALAATEVNEDGDPVVNFAKRRKAAEANE